MRALPGSSAAQSDRDDVWDLFILSQHKKQLTYLGKQDYKQLSQELHQSNCNFRYRVLDMDGNVLMDNLGGTAIGDQVDQVYDTHLFGYQLLLRGVQRERRVP